MGMAADGEGGTGTEAIRVIRTPSTTCDAPMGVTPKQMQGSSPAFKVCTLYYKVQVSKFEKEGGDSPQNTAHSIRQVFAVPSMRASQIYLNES